MERHVPMARRYKWNALADEGRHDVDVELVDFAGIKKRGDQLSPAHHPYVLSRRCAQALGKGFHRLRDEFHAWCLLLRWFARKYVVGELCVKDPAFAAVLLVIVESPVVGFASPQNRVNGAI